MLYLDLDMISSFRYYIKKEILYIDLTVVPYCSGEHVGQMIISNVIGTLVTCSRVSIEDSIETLLVDRSKPV